MTADDNMEYRLDDLDDLIRYLEEEKDRLKKSVEDAAKEWEFSQAKAFAKVHRHIAGRLRALKNLRDPGFDQRARHNQLLVSLEEMIKRYGDAPALVRHFTEELKETNKALDELENTKYPLIDTQHVDDAIFLLVAGKIDCFKLNLNKSEKLVFDFVCNDRVMQIGLSYKKGVLFSSIKKRLRKIGFRKVDGLRRFVRSVDVTEFKDAQRIKQLLAVVMFDVFGRSWFDKSGELEIYHNPDHPPTENPD